MPNTVHGAFSQHMNYIHNKLYVAVMKPDQGKRVVLASRSSFLAFSFFSGAFAASFLFLLVLLLLSFSFFDTFLSTLPSFSFVLESSFVLILVSWRKLCSQTLISQEIGCGKSMWCAWDPTKKDTKIHNLECHSYHVLHASSPSHHHFISELPDSCK